MSYRPLIASHGLILISVLVLVGCPPPATTKPDTTAGSPSVSPSPAAPGSVREQMADRGQERRQGQEARQMREARPAAPSAPPSLEALRRGQQPSTPAMSPLQEVYFDFDRYDLRADARETLRRNADWLSMNAAARVEIEGHCDGRGTNEYNLALGAKRAQAVKDYLVTLGISPDRLSTISYGEEVPVCRERNEVCWQKNRRARFVVLPMSPAS